MNSRYLKYYNNQIGGGGGEVDFGSLFRVTPRIQRGRGIGNLFSGLFRYLKPFIYSGLNAVKGEAIRQGGNIIQNIGTKPFSELLKESGVEGLHNLSEKAVNKLKTMSGSGKRGGPGREKEKRI